AREARVQFKHRIGKRQQLEIVMIAGIKMSSALEIASRREIVAGIELRLAQTMVSLDVPRVVANQFAKEVQRVRGGSVVQQKKTDFGLFFRVVGSICIKLQKFADDSIRPVLLLEQTHQFPASGMSLL